jgi:hypothetical protein
MAPDAMIIRDEINALQAEALQAHRLELVGDLRGASGAYEKLCAQLQYLVDICMPSSQPDLAVTCRGLLRSYCGRAEVRRRGRARRVRPPPHAPLQGPCCGIQSICGNESQARPHAALRRRCTRACWAAPVQPAARLQANLRQRPTTPWPQRCRQHSQVIGCMWKPRKPLLLPQTPPRLHLRAAPATLWAPAGCARPLQSPAWLRAQRA